MEGNIIDGAKNLLSGDFTTELRFRYITIGDDDIELELDGGAYMVIINYDGSKVASGDITFTSDYIDYRIILMQWESDGSRFIPIDSFPIRTNVAKGEFRVFFAVRAI